METKPIKPFLISVVGPTAIGKTKLAIEVARNWSTEIISADSRQFFKELEIGTAKPSQEELKLAKHHFVNSHSIEEFYSAGEYGRDAEILLKKLFKSYPVVVAVGGSSLYLKSLWEGFDDIPKVDESIRMELDIELKEKGLTHLLEELKSGDLDYYNSVDRNNGQRVVRALEVIRSTGQPFSSFRKSNEVKRNYENIKIGLDMDRSELFDRINKRMDVMIETGLFEEAEQLLPFRNHNALQTVGYSEIFDFLDGKYDKEEAIRLLKRNSRRYAKRQMTWFRRYGDIKWFHPNQILDIVTHLRSQLEMK